MIRVEPILRMRLGVTGGMQQCFEKHQQTETNPELATIEAVWSSSQIDARMPDYAQEIIRYFHR